MAAPKKTLAGLKGTVAMAPRSVAPTLIPDIGGLRIGPRLDHLKNTLESTLGELKGPDGENLLTLDQIVQLDAITMTNGDKFFSLNAESRPVMYQIIAQIYTWGYDSVYAALTSTDLTGRSEFYFRESPGMASSRHKSTVDAEIYRNKVEVEKGAFKCKKCGSEETIAVEKQMRAADEPTTIKVTCIHCGNKW